MPHLPLFLAPAMRGLVLGLLTCTLAACGGSNSSATDPAAPPVPGQPVPPDADAKPKLRCAP